MKDCIKNFIILILFILFSSYISFIMQKNPDFDFYAYHYYNGWAFWNDRINIDIMPAFARTYFNPILDGLNYFVITNFSNNPLLFYFINGLKYGLFLFLSYLYLNLLYDKKIIHKSGIIVSYLILIFFSPILIHNIGCDLIDIQINNLILISFYIFIKNIFEKYSFKQQSLLFISSLLIGAAIGLKYTAFIYFFSFLLCYIFNYKKLDKPIKTLSLFFIGVLVGFIVTDGWWLYKIYKHFHNPVFPYLNNIFNSSFGTDNSVLIDDFEHIRPRNIINFIFAPISNSLRGNTGFESGYFDLKISLTFCFILYYIFLKIKKTNLKFIKHIIDPNIFDTLIIFVVSSYYINTLVFGQLRYILALVPILCLIFIVVIYLHSYLAKKQPLENNIVLFIVMFCITKYAFGLTNLGFLRDFALLCILYALVTFFYIYFSKKFSSIQKHYYITILTVILLVISATNTPSFGRRPYHYSRIPLIKVEDLKIKDNSVVFCGSLTSCFIAPTQNSKARYVAYGIQDKYYNALIKKQLTKARHQYNSTYLKNITKEIFKENKDIYFVFAIQDTEKMKTIGPIIKKKKYIKQDNVDIYDVLEVNLPIEDNPDTKNHTYLQNDILEESNLMGMTDLDIYEKSLQDYSGRNVDFFKDCSVINYQIAHYKHHMNYYVICKIK